MDGAWVKAVNTISDISISGLGAESSLIRSPFPPQPVLVTQTEQLSDEVGALVTAAQHPSGANTLVVRSENGEHLFGVAPEAGSSAHPSCFVVLVQAACALSQSRCSMAGCSTLCALPPACL
jgi:hypothetical protein